MVVLCGTGLRVAVLCSRGSLVVLGCEFVIWVASCGWGARGSLAVLGCEFVIWVAGGRGSLVVLCGAGLRVAVLVFGLA